MSSADTLPRVHIGEVVRNAIVFKPGNHHSVNSDFLIETVASFFSLLRERQIEYVLVGGIALLQYIEGRNTEDIDLIMAVSSLERMPELLVETRDEDFARGKFGELKVDVFLTSNALFDQVRQRFTTTQRFVEQDIPCATVEGLILLKLYALPRSTVRETLPVWVFTKTMWLLCCTPTTRRSSRYLTNSLST